MHLFLDSHRAELVARCAAKVARRPRSTATPEQLANGIPLFIDQLSRTLRAEASGAFSESHRISGPPGAPSPASSEIGVSAAAHGKDLLALGFTVDQVVHDYGDLCQSITDLAAERGTDFGVEEFRVLNRCLDNAIADAVTEFSSQRDAQRAAEQASANNQRLGVLAHELRNSLGAAMLAVAALETGRMTLAGTTGGVLKRSHAAMTDLINRTIAEVRANGHTPPDAQVLSVAALLADAAAAAGLDAQVRGCTLDTEAADPLWHVTGHRTLLLAALANLLQNAFKFTRPGTRVTLRAHAAQGQVNIDVADHCGGMPPADADQLFRPFSQRAGDKTGLGLGLTIARQGVEADGGTLSLRNLPGTGCVFTIRLPLLAS